MAILAPLVAMAGGCFFELGGGYYPRTSQKVMESEFGSPITDDGGSWSASVKVGLYLDIPVSPIHSGLGLAWSPNGWGTDLIINRHGPRDEAGDGTMLRADVTLPVTPIPALSRINLRLIGEYGWFSDGGVRKPGEENYEERDPASGHRWFVGSALSFSTIGGSVIAAFGAQRMTVSIPYQNTARSGMQDGVETSAWGLGWSITLTLTPTSSYGHIAFASSPVISPGKGPAAGCDYVTTCDVDGNCQTKYVCP